MTVTIAKLIPRFLSPGWLTGPIFDKELRVSSRKRRNYVLRFAYLGLLTLFLVLVWLEEVRYGGSSTVYGVSRMAEAGKSIVICIVWFQFLATQVVAVIFFSTSISDEIYRRTLAVLMSTPVNSFQIVMGKLFSRLLQVILLLAVSLPLLAIVRIFGGVPWGYIISSFCMTLSTVILVSSLTMFLSIYFRRAYVVIILAVLILVAVFLVLPILLAIMSSHAGDGPEELLSYTNPYFAMAVNTEMMENPGVGPFGTMFYWPVHCVIVSIFSALILSCCVKSVRRVGLRWASGQMKSGVKKQPSPQGPSVAAAKPVSSGAPRPIRGSPVLWKELKSPMLGNPVLAAIVFISMPFVVIALLITYGFAADAEILNEGGLHTVYAGPFICLGILITSILPATCITSEKESRSWPLLLATTLSDREILLGKFIGILRRCGPAWVLLFGHILIFTLIGFIHPLAFFQIAIIVAGVIVFLSCSGFYFSARFKRTTTAVLMNIALAATIWAILPILMFPVANALDVSDDFAEAYIAFNPFVQTAVVLEGTTGSGWELEDSYDWPGFGQVNVAMSSLCIALTMLGYMFAGFLFASCAKYRMRKNIF